MTTETVALPEAGTRIRRKIWSEGAWVDVIAAALDEVGSVKVFGTDETGYTGLWSTTCDWELVVDENIENVVKLTELLDRAECPLYLAAQTPHRIAEYLVANGVTVS